MAVYAWGLGKNGQLGNGCKENKNLPTIARFEKGSGSKSSEKVVEISAGGLFTCIRTETGKVFSFGCGKHGRLGHADDLDHCEATPLRSLSSCKIKQVSCGLWHACAIDDEGVLFSWGYNKSHNVLGHDPQVKGDTSTHPVNALSSVKIVGVSCGNNFTLAWDVNGVAYSWGYGKHGVLGHGDQEDVETPKVIQQLSEHRIVFMSAGYSHCGAVTNNGQLFMFGQDKYGALGLGQKSMNDKCIPTQVPDTDGIQFKEISCSVGEHHGHTLALAGDSIVYAWGDGYKGKLGLGDQEFKYKPTPVPRENFNGETIRHVSAGGIHSSAVSEEGHVFTWGCGSDGRLGHPEASGHRYLFRSDVPRIVESLQSKGKAVDVRASYYHTVALVEPSK